MPLPIVSPASLTLPLTIAQGGTGQTTAALARQALGLQIGTDVPSLVTANTFSDTTDSTTISSGALILAGGMGIAKALFVGGALHVTDTTASSSSTTGALIVAGGIGAAKDSWINGVRIGKGAGSISTNTACGDGALNVNTTGSANAAFGNSAGFSITTGADSALLGAGALSNATTGSKNVAVGSSAGRLQVDGSTALALTGDDNIFVGANARGSSNTQTNSITIGTTAKSWGSNTIVLGNTTTSVTQLWGLGVNRGHIHGLTLSNNSGDTTNDIDIALGEARDSTGMVNMVLASALTGKRLDANWAAGSSAGMRNSAAAITDTTYHIWLVSKGDGSSPDIYAHTSTTASTVLTALQAETGGSAYLYLRRIGSIVRVTTILQFTQDGDYFSLTTPVLDVNVTNLTTARSTYTLASMPTGLRMRARFRALVSHATAGNSAVVSDLNETDAAPSTSAAPLTTLVVPGNGFNILTQMEAFTNTSAQICARASASSTTLRIATIGWVDSRGQRGASD